jgi:hypothetical protein
MYAYARKTLRGPWNPAKQAELDQQKGETGLRRMRLSMVKNSDKGFLQLTSKSF